MTIPAVDHASANAADAPNAATARHGAVGRCVEGLMMCESSWGTDCEVLSTAPSCVTTRPFGAETDIALSRSIATGASSSGPTRTCHAS